MALATVAFRPVIGLMTPRLSGPMTRIRPRRACSRIRRSSAAPSAPISLNPAEMMTTARTPASTHSPIRSGTIGAGVATMARSIESGTAPMRQDGFDPQHAPPLRVDQESGTAERLVDQVPHQRPGHYTVLSVAPMTAMFWARRAPSRPPPPLAHRASWRRDPLWTGRSPCSWVRLLTEVLQIDSNHFQQNPRSFWRRTCPAQPVGVQAAGRLALA